MTSTTPYDRHPTLQADAPHGYLALPNRRLHHQQLGDGAVSVIFEAGLGKSRCTWAPVQPLVAEFAHTVTYDRAGHGLSDPSSTTPDIDHLVDDHLAVIDALADRPCVLVGHSYGGPVARIAATLRPRSVRAVVLIDEVSELCTPQQMMASMRGASVLYGGQVLLARLHLLRPILRRTYFRSLRDQDAAIAAGEGSTVTATRTARAEWRAFRSSFIRLHDTGPHIPPVPVTAISARRLPPSRDDGRDFLGWSHKRTAELAPEGRHVYSESKNHYLQFTDTDLVVNEIRRIVDHVSTSA